MSGRTLLTPEPPSQLQCAPRNRSYPPSTPAKHHPRRLGILYDTRRSLGRSISYSSATYSSCTCCFGGEMDLEGDQQQIMGPARARCVFLRERRLWGITWQRAQNYEDSKT